MDYKLSIDKDFLTYGDSLLYPSGLEIASISCTSKDGNDKQWVSLQTSGNVKIIFKGSTYKDISQFPNELIDILRTKKGFQEMLDSGDLDIVESNWWEFVCSNGDGEVLDIEPREYKGLPALVDDLIDMLVGMNNK